MKNKTKKELKRKIDQSSKQEYLGQENKGVNSKFKALTVIVVVIVLGMITVFADTRLVHPVYSDTRLVHPVYSDDVDDYQKEIDQQEALKDAKEKILAETKEEISSISSSNGSINSKIAQLDKKIEAVQKDLDESEEKLTEQEEKLVVKQEELDGKNKIVENSVSSLYKKSRIGVLQVVFSYDNLGELFRAVNYQKYAVETQISVMQQVLGEFLLIQEEKESIANQKELLQVKKAAYDESMVDLKNEKARIQQEWANKIAMQNAVQSDIASINKELNSLTQALQNAILSKVGSGGGDISGGGNLSGGTSPQPPSGDAGKYDIYIDGSLVGEDFPGPIRVVSKSGGTSGTNVFKIGSGYYRGILEFRADTNVYMVNELPFEKYIYGLGEVPSSWPSESLKAQAVAGRTYAAKNWNKRSSYGYNLRDDTYDQNYVGYSKETASYGDKWVSAVNATSGKVIRKNGSMITAYYHSTCGGHTLSSKEVWGGDRSYAKAESDWYQDGGTWKSYDSASPWSNKRWGETNINYDTLVDLLNASLYLAVNPDSSTRQNRVRRSDLGGWTASQIVDGLGGEGSGNTITDKVGTVTDVKSVYNNGSTSISGSARKTESLKVYGSDGNLTIDGSVFWVVYNARSPGTDSIYYSNFWSAVKESSSDGGVWNFYTRGFPHRVGMCQWGAYGRAEAGQSYSQILTHYYRGTNIGSFSPSSAFRVGITRVATGDVFLSEHSGGDFDIYSYGVRIRSVNAGSSVRIQKQ